MEEKMEKIKKNLLEDLDNELTRVKRDFGSEHSPEVIERDYKKCVSQLEEKAAKLKEDIQYLAKELDFSMVFNILEGGAKIWKTIPVELSGNTPYDESLPRLEMAYYNDKGHSVDLLRSRESGVRFWMPSGFWRFVVIAIPSSKKEMEEEWKEYKGIR